MKEEKYKMKIFATIITAILSPLLLLLAVYFTICDVKQDLDYMHKFQGD